MKAIFRVSSLLVCMASCGGEKTNADVVDATDTSGETADNVDSGSEFHDSGLGSSPSDMPELILSRAAMLGHLNTLMDIAVANDGHRGAGSSGYDASADYVRGELEAAGYTVAAHEFNISKDVWNSEAEVSAVGLDPLSYREDFLIFGHSGSGSVTAALSEVNLTMPPADGVGISSGCEATDFVGFTGGNIALIQRGGCSFQVKVSHAVSAGASAVLIFNQGRPGQTALFGGALDADTDNIVPVYALSYAVAEALIALPPATLVSVVADFGRVELPTQNIVVETGGDDARVVVVGAHLDSVDAGPGINDNGSGVALVLEMAIQIAAENVETDNQLRFVFWGGEELGLLGSMDYVFSMDDADRARILANLNFDMVASPNPVRMAYDADGSMGGESGPPGSVEIEQIFGAWFAAEGLALQETPFDGRSDYGPFIWTGIPAGGLFSGAEQIKTADEADIFGGIAGESCDECYHQSCDTIDNIDLDVLGVFAAAASDAVLRLGMLSGPLAVQGPPAPQSATPSSVPKAPIQPDWLPSACASHERIWLR
jgi:Zn-dependent M28 family amino/carboxypeptidase